MAAISVGSVAVRVVPDARGFARQLRQDILGDSARIGAEIGATLGESIKKGLGDPVEEPLEDSTKKAPKQGAETAGAFAQGFRQRLKAAFKSLPEAEIGADTSEATKQLTQLRTQLVALSKQTIGVDVDAGTALAQLEEIRAGLTAAGQDAEINVRADTAAALRQLAVVQTEVDRLNRADIDIDTDRADASLRRLAASTDNAARSATLMRSELVTLIALAVGIAPPVFVAGTAFVGFAAIAAPSIIKVVAAQKDLAEGWDTLSAAQKATSANLSGLIAQYKALARSYEPETLAVFNGFLGDTSVLMERARPLLDASAAGVADLAGQISGFVTGGTMSRFLDFATKNAGPAFSQLAQTFTQTGTLALNLVQDLTPMGMTLLSTANGGLRLLNMVEQLNPSLVEFGVAALALRGPASGLSNAWTSASTKLATFSKEAKGASVASRALGLVTKAGPNLYIGAALALTYLVARLATAKDSTDNLVQSIRTENSAFGNNIQGHERAAASLSKLVTQMQEAFKARAAGGAVSENDAAEISRHEQKVKKLTESYKAELAAVNNIKAGEALLGTQYSLTADQAGQLATAAGVDLSKGITGSGDAAVAARAKIAQYQAAVVAAQSPTRVIANSLIAAGNNALQLKDRMAALTAAFNALAGPELQAFDATTKVAQAFAQMATAIAKSHGSMNAATQAGRNTRAAFVGLLTAVEQSIQAQYAFESATKGAAAAQANAANRTRAMLPLLLAQAGNSTTARNAVLSWANAHGVGKSRAEALAAALGRTKQQFLAAAHDANISRSAALKLWAAYEKLPEKKKTELRNNAAAQAKAVQDYQNKLDNLHGKTVTIHQNIVQDYINKRQAISGYTPRADGGIDRYASGGMRRDLSPHVVAQPTVLYGETQTGGEAYIPLGKSKRKRSTALLTEVAKMFGYGLTPMANGGILRFASGGTADANLSGILSEWTSRVKPASAGDLSSALKARAVQVDQLHRAEDALQKARKSGDEDRIAAAERRLRIERDDLRVATEKLRDVEARRNFAKQSPATQLSSALALSIKNTDAFMRNLTTLNNRGYGVLAQQLLAMGGSEAEKIAADAAKFSSQKLSTLQGRIGRAQQQQQQLANLPATFAAKGAVTSALASGKGSTWESLLKATSLAPDALALVIKGMAKKLDATPAGKALLVDMAAHGYASGGIRDPHIATSPTVLYGEPETGGEAYIPLGPAKRPQAEALLAEVARRFGGAYVKGGAPVRMAAGGTVAAPKAPAGPQPAQQAAGQNAVNLALAAGAERTRQMTVATQQLNTTKSTALAADKAATAAVRAATAARQTGTSTLTAATVATRVATTATRSATAADRAKAGQLGVTTAATRTSTNATAAAGRATDATRNKAIAFKAELGRVATQMGRTGQAAVTLTSRYQGIPRSVSTRITVNAKGQFTIQDLGGNFASGGPVYGAGTATSDSIPARLSNGEYVIRAAAHRRYGTGMLDAINTQRFAKGGSASFGGPVSFPGMADQVRSGLNFERMQSVKWTAEYVKKAIKKYYGSASSVVRAAISQLGQGDRCGDNSCNKFNAAFGFGNGTPWCANFVSWCIRAAGAQRRYSGYPSAAAAGYNSMRHVSRGMPGDLGFYGGHINIIERPAGGGMYHTIGGNEGPVVKRGLRSPPVILRPAGMAAGGPVDARVFRDRNFDPADRKNPLLGMYRSLPPKHALSVSRGIGHVHPDEFDAGGWLRPGPSLVYNGTGRPEPVLTAGQFDALVDGRSAGGDRTVNIMPGAQITVEDRTDVDLLAQRTDFLARSATF